MLLLTGLLLLVGFFAVVGMAKITKVATIGGRTISGTMNRTEIIEIGSPKTLAAGKTGVLTVRTDNNTGSLTMTAGHGIITGAVIDLYWVGGRRQGMVVGTVATNVVPIDGGTGDNLPLATTAIVACVVTTINIDVTGDDVVIAAFGGSQRTAFSIQQNDGTPIKEVDLAAGESFDYVSEQGQTNPFAGVTIGKVLVSNGGVTASTVNVGVGYE